MVRLLFAEKSAIPAGPPNELNIDSLVPLLRTILQEAGVDAPELYSAHSLRRGFASWATANGWDLKTLMEHVGWKNAQSAMRYIDREDSFNRHRIELNLLPPASK